MLRRRTLGFLWLSCEFTGKVFALGDELVRWAFGSCKRAIVPRICIQVVKTTLQAPESEIKSRLEPENRYQFCQIPPSNCYR